MASRNILVVGGGAAGFFGAIAAAEACPESRVVILERGARFLDKVRISGGGRCNVTHACFEPREFATRYPRGSRALLAPFHQFSARDTVAWFEARGVRLKTEKDGRMFPTTDTSQTIVDCLQESARRAGVETRLQCAVETMIKRPDGLFEVSLAGGSRSVADRVLLATGGCRSAALGALAASLGHTLEPPVPSLFTFHVACPWLQSLAGVSVDDVELHVAAAKLKERGPLLVTHWGLSGPVVLRLSAWGARELHAINYRFTLRVNWIPSIHSESLQMEFQRRRSSQPAKRIVNYPVPPVPMRLWEQLVLAAGIPFETRWAGLSRAQSHALAAQLNQSMFEVTGKSLNKEEFVTCGGVKLGEVDLKTMESRVCPGLHFAGEILDVDGITGGFNFQAAWTTGYLAGRAMAGALD